MKILICIDMQNDFVNGSLGTKEAERVVPYVVNKINTYRENDNDNIIIFTQDTHSKSYLSTFEGEKLPIPHCIKKTNGWEFTYGIHTKVDENKDYIFEKGTFGLNRWKDIISSISFNNGYKLESIELCGLCTDICVISNALIIRSSFPSIPIIVDAKCCAGSTPEKHLAALEVMKSCQIDIINE